MQRAFWIVAALALTLGGGSAAQAQTVIFYPQYGPLWSGPVVNNLGMWQQLNQPFGVMNRPVGNYPIAGLNSPPIGRSQTRRVSFRDAGDPAPASAVRGSRESTRDREKLANRLEEVMSQRALVSGTVVKVGATGVSVRLEAGKQARSERYDLDEVFFFRGGELATAKSAPGVLLAGDRVLVPQPTDE